MGVNYEQELQEWVGNERLALELLNTGSQLQLNKSIELVLFRRKVFDKKISSLIHDHAYLRKFAELPITLEITSNLARSISKLDLAPSRIDLGRLGSEWINEGSKFKGYDDFVSNKLKEFIGVDKKVLKPRDV